jgi:hypothetical protein
MTAHITLIFYDVNSIEKDARNVFLKYPCLVFNEQQSCVDYIISVPMRETLFLLTSASSAIQILPNINGLRQLDSIFILLG